MEVNPYPGKVPGSREWDEEHGEPFRHERFYGGSSPCTVTIYGPQGPGRGGPGPYPEHRDEEYPPPASLPLTGTEMMMLKQYVSPWNRLRNVVVNVLSFITSFFRTGYSWGKTALTADTPTTTLFTTGPTPLPYQLVLSVACTIADGSSSTGTYTLSATAADGTSFPKTGTFNLNSVGSGTYISVGVMLQPNTPVSFSVLGGTYSGGAQYALFVSAFPQVAPQQIANNVMY